MGICLSHKQVLLVSVVTSRKKSLSQQQELCVEEKDEVERDGTDSGSLDSVINDELDEFKDDESIAIENEMNDLRYDVVKRMSESVFVGLCQIIVTSQLVSLRRDLIDIGEILNSQGNHHNDTVTMWSGSTREGFRFKESDIDIMFWPKDVTVIWNICPTQFQDTTGKTLILADCSECLPGFCLLELLRTTKNTDISEAKVRLNDINRTLEIVTTAMNGDFSDACEREKNRTSILKLLSTTENTACDRENDRFYISSSRHRELKCLVNPDISTLSGPCGSGKSHGIDFDIAYSLASDFWPPSASSWKDRCQSWPPSCVINDILRNGCQLVPIGHPYGRYKDEEWRISFSLAEQKLVYSMNHCQYLTYGLLKVFLKEVINHQIGDTNKLLCSYHMKTTIFWVIQQNMIHHWCPQNLLECFWVCFKVILRWVYEGVCPNFFIPQNNMFLVKIHGSAQERLFLQLYTLYTEGLACLMQSPSLKSYINDVLSNPKLPICTNENKITAKLFNEFIKKFWENADLKHCLKCLQKIEELVGLPLTPFKIIMLKNITTYVLQSTAFVLHNKYKDTGVNKLIYVADKISRYMLNLASKLGCISDMLYMALYYHKTLRYQKALTVIDMTKVKLAQPYVMYGLNVDTESYTEAVGGQSLSKKMRNAVAQNILLLSNTFYMRELSLEQLCNDRNRHYMFKDILVIPPFVFLHMLDILCSRKTDTTRAQTALHDLQCLIEHQEGVHVPLLYRDISWQILGFCQQISGNLDAALDAYQQSLDSQDQHHLIQRVTLIRMLGILDPQKSLSVSISPGKQNIPEYTPIHKVEF
ncbi:uncharacterized protein LOC133203006 [Saccostrea echinata]|uniref:uncharacterized protein LOC133203006 n=1 Tax=Saccostrea echinata TaxID=191078 RepID=UPI002A7FF4C0|nr:uncharacterized protein LOC133203006 [Saccostrea echinata]